MVRQLDSMIICSLETKKVFVSVLPQVYLSREKRLDHEHNKKAGAMNALVRASALITNGSYVMNLDCDHYVNNSEALREVSILLLLPSAPCTLSRKKGRTRLSTDMR